jgi:hypothetical protein
MLPHALAYAALGWPVFPCLPGSKNPATPHGFKNATTDPEIVTRWFSGTSYNVAIATGGLLWVLDIDPAKGGEESLEALEAAHGTLPPTLTAETRNAGTHLYLLGVPGLKCSAGRIGPGLDVRAEGGYVLAPPSHVPADQPGGTGAYSWVNSDPAASAPAWLLEAATAVRERSEAPVPLVGPREAAPEVLADLADALLYLDYEDRDVWVRTGMALKSLGEAGYVLWDEWSARSSAKYDANDMGPRWHGFGVTALNFETVFYDARKAGWRAVPAAPAPSSVFGGAPTPTPAAPTPTPPGIKSRTGDGFLLVEGQAKHFQGCVYVQDVHRIMLPYSGALVKPEQFKARFGGYFFSLDEGNVKTTTDAWEVFTLSRALEFPRADGLAFLPAEAPGALIEQQGRKVVNTYWPCVTDKREGDAAPYWGLVRKMLPDPRDAEILLSYQASMIQYPGRKFGWAPVIQGTEGNGKTLLLTCIQECLGLKYCHWPKADKLSKDFNAWMLGKLAYLVDEIYVPGHRHQVVESLKAMITGTELEIEGKGVDQFTAAMAGNFLFATNHQDAITVNESARRFAMLFCAQQSADDLRRDGMDGDYFPNLWNWLRAGGFGIVHNYLATYPIAEEFNPTGKCHRAPKTSSSRAAIVAGQGSAEQEIQEQIDQGAVGFRDGWVSSIWLDRLLTAKGLERALPIKRRKEILQGMGYSHHPGLREGRTDNPVSPDMSKPRLYIREGHPLAGLTGASEIARAYELAQAGSGGAATAAFKLEVVK